MFSIFRTNKKGTSRSSFFQEFQELKRLEKQTIPRFKFEAEDFYPCLEDNTPYTPFDRHYIYHPAWAARVLQQTRPEKHVDISSTLYFCSIVSAFIPVDFYDYRPANLCLSDFRSLKANLLSLPFESGSVESISCMHTVEHVGLGRYGDTLDYDGDLKAVNELIRVVQPKGDLLFVVPVGCENKISFNAHRIYTKEHVLRLFGEFDLKQFCLIPENESHGGLIESPTDLDLARETYGCGCFWFKKR